MKTKVAAFAVMAVLVVLCPSATVMLASDSDAADVDYSAYYGGQLEGSAHDLYAALKALSLTDPVQSGDRYIYTVPLGVASLLDLKYAWTALKLDDPYAVVTWTKNGMVPTIEKDGANAIIVMDSMFADAITKKAAVQTIIDAIEIKSTDAPSRTKEVNGILTGSAYKYDPEGADGVFGILGDGEHKLSSAGFSALFKVLCERDVNGFHLDCMQIFGTISKSVSEIYAWNEVVFEGGKVYVVDSAANNDAGRNVWLGAGRYSADGSSTFAKDHLAFPFDYYDGLLVVSYKIPCNDGYEWPDESTILDKITEYMPWILIGIICCILAYALVKMAKKGEI